MMREVSLNEVLEAREARALLQRRLSEKYKTPVISFTMNIAGPVKDSPLLRRAFFSGIKQLEAAFTAARLTVLEREQSLAATGCEAVYAVKAASIELKRLCVSIEDESALGRLFDIDVLDENGQKLDRELVGGGARNCIVCGAAGRGCASRRTHSVEVLQTATRQIIERHFFEADRDEIACMVTKALLDEVCVTPKPGLVDRDNNGSHRDMDIYTFTASAAALQPYWARFMKIGQETAKLEPQETFNALKIAGQKAERDMFLATNGVNTHKGAIFTLGLLCGAVGRLWRAESVCRSADRILNECAAMAAPAAHADFDALRDKKEQSVYTAGERLYLSQGIAGVRGEASKGFPAVAKIAIPALKAALAEPKSLNDAGAITLLHLIANVTDTNMISRGGLVLAQEASKRCAQLIRRDSEPAMCEIAELDRWFIERNLSAGGCADLLSAAFFLLGLESMG